MHIGGHAILAGGRHDAQSGVGRLTLKYVPPRRTTIRIAHESKYYNLSF